jgi:hypothetical protein
MKPGKWESEIQNLTTELLTQTDYRLYRASRQVIRYRGFAGKEGDRK